MRQQILDELEPMIQEAKEKQLMIQCNGRHREVRFYPHEFKEQLNDGKFIWGRCNWDLENPTIAEQEELLRMEL